MTTETGKPNFKPAMIVFTLLAVIGVICWVLQLTRGLDLTNLNNFNSWGLYIIGFMLFTGVAAGSLIFASSAYLFQAMAEFKPYARIAAFVGAIGSVIAAGLFIVVDIGNPERAWYIITKGNMSSPMFWDTIILGAYVVIGIILTRQLVLVAQGDKEEKSLKIISLVAFVCGLLVTVTSFVFCLQVARPLWNNPVQPISFLMAALVAALAVLIIVFAVLRKSGYIQMSDEALSKMGKIAGIVLCGELLVVLGEVAVGMYPGGGEETSVIEWLVTGIGAPFFWIEMICIIAGIGLLLNKRRELASVGAGIGLIAIFLIKYNLLQAQLLNPLITYAGPPEYGVSTGIYLPSLIEVGVSVGILSLGSLLVILGLSKLNLGHRNP